MLVFCCANGDLCGESLEYMLSFNVESTAKTNQGGYSVHGEMRGAKCSVPAVGKASSAIGDGGLSLHEPQRAQRTQRNVRGKMFCDHRGEICNPESGKDLVTNERITTYVSGTCGGRVCWGV